MFEIFHLQITLDYSNACDNFHFTKKNPLSVVEFIFSIAETFHTHIYIFVAFLGTGNKNVQLIALYQ